MSTFGERLKEERERLGLSQTEFGKLANVQKQAQLKYEKGERNPGSCYLTLIGCYADVLYILTGRRDAAQLAPDEAALLDNYRNSSEAGKRTIRGAASASAQQEVEGKESAA